MGLFRMVTAGAVGYVAYKAWQRRQEQAAQAPRTQAVLQDRQDVAARGTTPPHGDPLRNADGAPAGRKQALGALAIFNEQERTLAQLAVVKGVDGPLLEFARKMDEVHSAALTDLSRFAPDRTGAQAQAAAARSEGTRKQLEQLHGQAFQTQYLQASIASHERALSQLDTQLSSEPGSSDLGKELQRMRATIAEHLEHAKTLRAKQSQPH
ncbi:DUF4142 domain-containing protein [Xanthomonas floridensis]|uniref:DUF4142 domain-containing protein n=1 Tax=Xanthomonas floridensis TaxID=1843580 RepID=A0A1A9M6P1_9XANT|nr:DUF4142 domain-containing protein [Xanthomonas floridensis]MEA5122671.1 DUF4142 domain-containing protein [Xanthomonas floridensis]MEA5131289.1 DUF4142 domain-containing protein [Xanthomonas floridensis]OAG66193.1 hypothetical protein A7D17_04510 [Xanthomonas floridensis]